jgi:hypothetical protein
MLKLLEKIYNKITNLFSKNSIPLALNGTEETSLAPKELRYFLVDPSMPELVASVINPIPFKLPISVKSYSGKSAPFDTLQGQAANTYAVLCRSINAINAKINLNKWALVKVLNVEPAAGNMPNAYYDRQNLKFFSFQGKSGKKVFTCLSYDIVAHELGHALLDGMRPEFFSMASLEIWSFHESFGDINAIFASLYEPLLVNYLLTQTGGDLKKQNILGDLAEQFGKELGMQGALRKAINSFVYVKPETLPKQAPESQLSAECHSFSRVMTGAFFDIFVEVYKAFGGGQNGIQKARDFLIETFMAASKTAPTSANFYNSFAMTWTRLSMKQSPAIGQIMNKVFVDRKIIAQPIASVTAMNMPAVNVNFLEERKDDESVVTVNEGFVLVKDLFHTDVIAQSAVLSEIMDLKLTLPLDEMVVAQGEEWQPVCCDAAESCACAKTFVEFIIEKDLYGQGEEQSWYKDENNNLVRKHISCCGDNGFINNCKVPGNPEFGKCWKCKNNTGCCTYGSCGCEEPPKPKVILPCRTRYNTCSITRYNSSCGATKYGSHPYGANSAGINPVPYT